MRLTLRTTINTVPRVSPLMTGTLRMISWDESADEKSSMNDAGSSDEDDPEILKLARQRQQYLDPRTARDPTFFRHPTAEQFAAIREEEEEEESSESDEGEDAQEERGDSDEVLGKEDVTPEQGSYSEGEQSEEEEDEEEEEEHEDESAGSEWEAVPEEALRTGTEAEDPEAARKREEIAAGKELELASAASLQIHDDPNGDLEPP
ncbi:hypothetical protein CBR_g51977 [Chara braunii]|uniref:Uncharacterized protein n=1 Tax=Chara braunii TaxID=69332 RepID=A0A388K6L1_CHABU|nr:hypothetical protein CBR_g51977 [Chara braunii]|eukprot:GBG65677.1 hypothetical protein CBR_g51977 [Chara braunii]